MSFNFIKESIITIRCVIFYSIWYNVFGRKYALCANILRMQTCNKQKKTHSMGGRYRGEKMPTVNVIMPTFDRCYKFCQIHILVSIFKLAITISRSLPFDMTDAARPQPLNALPLLLAFVNTVLPFFLCKTQATKYFRSFSNKRQL